jgi:hypothetical protein
MTMKPENVKKRRPFQERLKAEMYDTPLRWLVESESVEGESHLVDLQEWTCTCTDYTVRRASLYRETKDRKLCACKHVKCSAEAFMYLMLDLTIKAAIEQEEIAKNNQQKKTNE